MTFHINSFSYTFQAYSIQSGVFFCFFFFSIPVHRDQCALQGHNFSRHTEGQMHISISDEHNSFLLTQY